MVSDPRSLVPAGIFTVLGASFVVHVAYVWSLLDCTTARECGTPGLVQLVIAGLGLLPALATLALAVSGRGHPWRWLLLTMLVYAAWGVYVSQVFVV
jgi:hypothetical protein